MKNPKVLLKEIKNYDLHIDDVPSEFWNNEEYIIELLDINEEVFKFFRQEKKNSKEFVINLINEYKCFGIYEFLSDELKNDKEIVEICINENIDKVPDIFKLDETFIINTLSNQPMKLCYFPDSVKDNLDYVSLSVKNNGMSFIHSSERLRNDIQLIYQSTCTSEEPNIISLEYIGDELKENIDQLKKLVDLYLVEPIQNEYIIDYLIKELNNTIQISLIDYLKEKSVYPNKNWITNNNKNEFEFNESKINTDKNSYFVTFELKSNYENSNENLTKVIEKKYQSTNLYSLFDELDELIENDLIDDSICLNEKSTSRLLNTSIEYIQIKDQNDEIIYESNN